MSQKPQNEMNFRPGQMSEESEYVIRESRNFMQTVQIQLQVMDKKHAFDTAKLQEKIRDLEEQKNTAMSVISNLRTVIIELFEKLDADNVVQNSNVTNSSLDVDYSATLGSKT